MNAVALVGLLAVAVACSSDAEQVGIDGAPVVTVSIPDEPTRPPVLVMPVLAGELSLGKPGAPEVGENGELVFAGLTLGEPRDDVAMLEPGAVTQGGTAWELSLTVTRDAVKTWDALHSECSSKAESCPTGRVALVDGGKVLGVAEVRADGAVISAQTREVLEKTAEALR